VAVRVLGRGPAATVLATMHEPYRETRPGDEWAHGSHTIAGLPPGSVGNWC
jgi:hypothetical protein